MVTRGSLRRRRLAVNRSLRAINDSYSQLTMLLLKSCDYLEVLDLKPGLEHRLHLCAKE
jgi:hypothetical protein